MTKGVREVVTWYKDLREAGQRGKGLSQNQRAAQRPQSVIKYG